jgi:hypothetical protein
MACGLWSAPRLDSPWDAALDQEPHRPRCGPPRHTLDDDSLDWFFDAWVYGTRFPRYSVTYAVGSPTTLTIEQIKPTATLFRMPIDVWVATSTDTFASGLYFVSIETAADSRLTKVTLIK